ncbi:MAG TPA: hypothetical protein DCQ80_15470 [Pseudomonas sp.]|nr:hypothetical protein [Pseudomonas sp.]
MYWPTGSRARHGNGRRIPTAIARSPRVCCRFVASRVAAPNSARQGAGRRQWSFPCQIPQRRMALFAAQPFGPGAAAYETATDPSTDPCHAIVPIVFRPEAG